MALKCSDIIDIMNTMANPNLAEDWDNVGLIIGDGEMNIRNILLSLDINDDIIDEAIEKNCNMIITHHPFIFNSIKKINNNTTLGKRIFKIIQNNIAIFSAHTNLDICENGTNTTFAKLLSLKNIENLCPPVDGINGLGKVGYLDKEITLEQLIDRIKSILSLQHLVFSGDLSKKVKKIAIGTGKCSSPSYISLAKKHNCDCYITSDIGYHDAQFAIDEDIALIDATHYASENIVLNTILEYLKKEKLDTNIFISEISGQTLKIV